MHKEFVLVEAEAEVYAGILIGISKMGKHKATVPDLKNSSRAD